MSSASNTPSQQRQPRRPRPLEVPSPPSKTLSTPTPDSDQKPKITYTTSQSNASEGSSSEEEDEDEKHERTIAKKSRIGLLGLVLAIGGAQIVASVQSAWGSTHLFNLGLATQSTALVWLAVPLAQVIVQPIVGALSDDEAGRFRRRSWIIGSALILTVSIAYLINAEDFAIVLARNEQTGKTITVSIAVVAVYVLNASLTGLQSGTRDLAIDVAPPSQQATTSALGNRVSDLFSLLSYLVGALPLERLQTLRWIGGGQFSKLAWLATAAMATTVFITCSTQHEKPELQTVDRKRKGLIGRWRELKRNINRVPTEIRRVCYVQIFSWMAMFPFQVYSTTYVANVVLVTVTPSPSSDTAARFGSFALFFYALVSLLTAATIPSLTLLSSHTSFAAYLAGPSTFVRRTLARILLFLSARNFWSFGLFFQFLLMMATFWVENEYQAMAIVALMGAPAAISLWAPYALLAEAFLVEQAEKTCPSCSRTDMPSREDYNAAMNSDSSLDFDHIPHLHLRFRLPRHRSHLPTCPNANNDELDPFDSARPFHSAHSGSSRLLDDTDFEDPKSALAGLSTTIVTLHNLSMLLPQALITFLAAAAFKWVNDRFDAELLGGETKRDTDEITWLFRVCGVLALVAACIARTIGETRWESRVRKKLAVRRWI